jgi:hypothetical protein
MSNLESDYTAAFIARQCDGDRRAQVQESIRRAAAWRCTSFADEPDSLHWCVSAYARTTDADA